jgi:hypothetical protein
VIDDMRWIIGPLIPIVAIIGAFATAIVQSIQRARIRELEIRERIAMIERGLMPPPEVDPRGFDRAMHRYDRLSVSTSAARHRRAGIVLIGIGVGMMILIGSSGAPEEGFGVGGFLCVLGLAFLINSLFELRHPSGSQTGSFSSSSGYGGASGFAPHPTPPGPPPAGPSSSVPPSSPGPSSP